MFEPVLKTMSLSLIVLLAASNAPASGVPEREPQARSQADIERGWAEQQQKFEARLAARGLRDADIPGAIISAPLPGFQVGMRDEGELRHAQGAAPAERSHGRSGPRD